jgi:hypothetical protein
LAISACNVFIKAALLYGKKGIEVDTESFLQNPAKQYLYFATRSKGEDMSFQKTDLGLLQGLTRKVVRRIQSLGAKQRKLTISALICIMFASTPITLLAQTAGQPSDTPAAQQLTPEQQAAIQQLEYEKKVAELRKAIRDAQFNPTVTAPEGKIELNNVFIETQILSYKAMSEVAEKISKEIHQNFGGATMCPLRSITRSRLILLLIEGSR